MAKNPEKGNVEGGTLKVSANPNGLYDELSEEKRMREGCYDGVFDEACGKIRSKFNLPKGDYDYHIRLEYRDSYGNLCHRNLYLRDKIVSVRDENGVKYDLNMYGDHLRVTSSYRHGNNECLNPVSLSRVVSEFNDFLKLPNDRYFIEEDK